MINVTFECKFCDKGEQCLLVKGVKCSGTTDESENCPEWSTALNLSYILHELRDISNELNLTRLGYSGV